MSLISFISQPIWLALVVCVLLQTAGFIYQWKTRQADIVDMVWSWGIVIIAALYQLMIEASFLNRLLVLVFPMLWYSRLGWHLLNRYQRGQEDSRYAYLRAHWQHYEQPKFFGFFMFQAVLIWLFSVPAYWLLSASAISYWQAIAAVILGVGALAGVSLADHQLHHFKQTHDSKEVCNVGLWQFSRHPNYFFEWLHWFVYPILLWHSNYFYGAVVMVALMLIFLMKLTGIPFAEQQAIRKRGDAYRTYQHNTPAFFLWRSKNDK